MLHAFDPAQARVAGLRTGWLHYGLLTLLSQTIVATLTAVGLILAVAPLVTPGGIAFLDSAPAPTIVLVLSTLFVFAFLGRIAAVRSGARADTLA